MIRKLLIGIVSLIVLYPPSYLGASTVLRSYAPSDQVIFNPERGFWRFGTTVDTTNYIAIRNAGMSLCYAYILLDQFRASAISQARLDEIDRAFGRMRNAGVKGITRIAYDNTAAGQDTSLEWMQFHLDQLRPVLEDNADVIALFQAGMIGAWGEWHSSSNNHHLNPGPVWNLLLEYLPPDRFIAVRTPKFVNMLENLDSAPLTAQEAFTFESRARIAHHNDCWLASATDYGTYDWRPTIRRTEKDQIANQSKYTPWGGETCHLDTTYSNCTTAVAEAQRFHATYLHDGWNPDVIDELKAGGCWDNELAKKLGYRFELIDAELPDVLIAGRQFGFTIRLKNVGWAPLFNERPVFLLVLNNDNIIAQYELTNNADPRRWLPESGVIILSQILRSPETIAGDAVDLALWLPDLEPQNRPDPDFSVQFANQGTWNPAKGYNMLLADIPVLDFLPGDCDNDGLVDVNDLAVLAQWWLEPCTLPDLCDNCNLDETGDVNFADFGILVSDWNPAP